MSQNGLKIEEQNCETCVHKVVCKFKETKMTLISEISSDFDKDVVSCFKLCLKCDHFKSSYNDTFDRK